jgi:transcriptional regulator with XRE-family HTH domain
MNTQTALSILRQRGMTQAEIAAAIGLTQGAISAIEIGKRKDVRLSTYQKLIELVNQPVANSKEAADA